MTQDRLDGFGIYKLACQLFDDFWNDSEFVMKDERGAALVAAFAGRASELGLYAAAFLLALDWQVSPTTHLVIVGPREDETAEEMRRLALATFVPRKVVQRLTTEEAGSRPLPAALAGMLSAASGSRAYLCTGNVCRRPAESVQEWRATLQARVLD